MKDLIFCVYDRLSGRYGNVFSSPTRATAEQQFKNLFQKQPEAQKDFDLCVFGSFEIGTGQGSFHPLERVEISLDSVKSEIPINEIEKKM